MRALIRKGTGEWGEEKGDACVSWPTFLYIIKYINWIDII